MVAIKARKYFTHTIIQNPCFRSWEFIPIIKVTDIHLQFGAASNWSAMFCMCKTGQSPSNFLLTVSRQFSVAVLLCSYFLFGICFIIAFWKSLFFSSERQCFVIWPFLGVFAYFCMSKLLCLYHVSAVKCLPKHTFKAVISSSYCIYNHFSHSISEWHHLPYASLNILFSPTVLACLHHKPTLCFCG